MKNLTGTAIQRTRLGRLALIGRCEGDDDLISTFADRMKIIA
jgi:hypothetical protein